MKKIFALVLFLVLGKFSYSQYPLQQNLGNDSTIVVSKGATQSRFVNVTYTDTASANLQRIRQYPASLIATTSGGLRFWIRNSSATGWIEISTTSSTVGVTSVATNNATGITGGTITSTGTLAIDTLLISTRAWRQKGIDSVASLITGSVSGTTNYVSKFTATNSLGNSQIFDNGTSVGFATATPDSLLTVELGTHLKRGVRLSGLPQAPGTKSLRIDANGTLSIADTTSGGGVGTVTSVATNNGTGITGGTITTAGTLAIDTLLISTRAWRQKGIDSVAALPRVTSVGLTMPAAFAVAGSPVTTSGTLAVTGAGLVSQYIRGDGTLADFPGGGGGGGASVSYYLNGSINQGTFVGNTYYEMNKTPILGAGTDFSINADGYIAQFITDAGDPGLLKIPGGNWNFELFFNASSGGGNPTYYVELYKYDGTTFTLIASGSTNPDVITGGTAVEAYFSTLPVPETVLTLTDRLAVRIYVTHAGRTITLHTEDNNLCQVITTFTTGITAINSLTAQVQYLTTGTSGTDFNISSLTDTHTFNLPTASATNRGALSSADWTTFNNKGSVSSVATNNGTGITGGTITTSGTLAIDTLLISTRAWRQKGIDSVASLINSNISGTTNYVPKFTGTNTIGNSNIFDDGTNVGLFTASPLEKLDVRGRFLSVGTTTTTESAMFVQSQWGGGPNKFVTKLAANSQGNVVLSSGYNIASATAPSSATVTEILRADYLGNVGIGGIAPDSMLTVNLGTHLKRGVRMSGLPTGVGTKALRIDANGRLSIADTTTAGVGTVTSVATNNGTGITGGTITTSGTLAIDTLLISTRAWRQKGIDSVAALPRVTSVATNTGTGITGGTITTSGTIAADTLLLSTRAWRQKGIDSVAALPRVTSVGSGYGLSGGTITTSGTLLVDSATLSNYYLRRKDSLTATNLLGYVTRKILADTAAAIRSAGGTGTVTSVATNTGTGITGGTITTSGTLAIDTLLISTRAWRQKGIDSVQANLTAGLALKLNISDTANMLNPYLRKVDTASLSNRINTKLNISDTSSMLTNYLNNVGYGLLRTGQVARADSATLANYFLRRKDSLTSTNLLGYVTRKVLADTAAAIRSADAGGTVTSVATNTGTGITGGTITTAGTLAIDTTLISTRAWRQKGVDSLQANINLKLNISDTASMLSPYLRSNTAAATYVPQTRTITINGTSQDLSANRTYNVGTVTSVATSSATGITGGTFTTSGTIAADTLLLSTRAWRQKGIDSVAALANTKISGSGTTNYIPKFTSSSAIGNSIMSEGSSLITVNAGNIGTNAGYGLVWSGDATRIITPEDNVSGALIQTPGVIRFNSGGTSERMRLDASGNLGLGTTTIGSKLQVNGGAAIGYSASTAAPTNGLLVSGNVGIGTTAPFSRLEVNSGTGTAPTLKVYSTPSSYTANLAVGIIDLGTNASGNDVPAFRITGISETVASSANGYATFSTRASGTVTERMRITSGGSIGIGTTTIGSTLQVNGNAAIGYSASTAAPTNGLAVAGGVTIGTATNNVSSIVASGYSLTGANAQSLIDLAGTWNTTGNPTAIKLNVTNTASGTSSKLMDLQVGGTSQFQVTKGGAIQTVGGVPWKLTGGVVTLGGSNLQGISVDVNGTTYYLVTGYLPEPEPDPAALPASGPSANYKTYNKPTPVKSAQDAKIQTLEREVAELKEMVKKLANK